MRVSVAYRTVSLVDARSRLRKLGLSNCRISKDALVKTPHIIESIQNLVKRAREKHGKTMTRAHIAILNEIETALDRDRNGIRVLRPEQANIYLKQMEHVMAGAVGDREWGLHEALKAKVRKVTRPSLTMGYGEAAAAQNSEDTAGTRSECHIVG